MKQSYFVVKRTKVRRDDCLEDISRSICTNQFGLVGGAAYIDMPLCTLSLLTFHSYIVEQTAKPTHT